MPPMVPTEIGAAMLTPDVPWSVERIDAGAVGEQAVVVGRARIAEEGERAGAVDGDRRAVVEEDAVRRDRAAEGGDLVDDGHLVVEDRIVAGAGEVGGHGAGRVAGPVAGVVPVGVRHRRPRPPEGGGHQPILKGLDRPEAEAPPLAEAIRVRGENRPELALAVPAGHGCPRRSEVGRRESSAGSSTSSNRQEGGAQKVRFSARGGHERNARRNADCLGRETNKRHPGSRGSGRGARHGGRGECGANADGDAVREVIRSSGRQV